MKTDVRLADLTELSARTQRTVAEARTVNLAPDTVKRAPLFSLTDVELVTGVPIKKIRTVLQKHSDELGSLPQGRTKDQLDVEVSQVGLDGRGQKRYYTPDEFHRVVKAVAPQQFRPAGQKTVVITLCNFKGGVTKSTSCACVAQALSSLGFEKILCIDLDPQGSLTNLFGMLQAFDVQDNMTALPILEGEVRSFKNCIRTTYWPGIDLIPSTPALHQAEYHFEQHYKVYGDDVMCRLTNAITDLDDAYDFILIDTPPALNQLTLHALSACDGVMMPLPPSNLDLTSSVKFWDLYINFCNRLLDDADARRDHGEDPVDRNPMLFKFVEVFCPKTENTRSCRNVLSLIEDGYGSFLSKTTVPKSAAVSTASDAYGTVFDVPIDPTLKLTKSHDVVRAAYLELAKNVINVSHTIWTPI